MGSPLQKPLLTRGSRDTPNRAKKRKGKGKKGRRKTEHVTARKADTVLITTVVLMPCFRPEEVSAVEIYAILDMEVVTCDTSALWHKP